MNRIHNLICSSGWWSKRVEQKLVPWGISDVELGERILELGPGFGATTKVLAQRLPHINVLELEPGYVTRLRRQLGPTVTVLQGDATAMPYPDAQFSSVLCFTMLHHIPSRELQDRAFTEIARVLVPGGTFAGTDNVGSGIMFKLIHIGDTLLLLDPDELPGRLRAAGLAEVEVDRTEGSFRFRARKPSTAR